MIIRIRFRPLPMILLLVGLFLLPTIIQASPIKRLSELTSGSMVVEHEQGANTLPLLDTQVRMTITGMNVKTEVKQFFENPSPDYVNATYYFPLPEDAAVSRLEMLIGDRLIVGKIKEKQEAKRIYNEAVKAGKKAALLEQDRANLFRNKVANIAPGETIEITLTMHHKVRYSQGTFSLRFPTTITPRYEGRQTLTEQFKPDEGAWSQQAHTSTEAGPVVVHSTSRKDQQLSIDVSLDAGVELAAIRSNSHSISSHKRKHNQYEIGLQKYHVTDRDFELSWTPRSDKQPRLLSFTQAHESDPGYLYTQVVVLPPTDQAIRNQAIARDVTFIIDHSGSMQGQSMSQAKLALTQAISDLSAQDRFNVIGYNHEAHSLFHGAVPVDQQSKHWALDYLQKMEANGGTEMVKALTLALNEPTYPDRVRQIIFLTDGAVSYEDKLFEMIHSRLGDARLFTIGIGSAPNSYFMRKAAEFGQGTYTYISNSGDIATKMTQLLEQLRYPVMQDVQIEFSEPVEHYPLQVPDLYLGEPIHLIIRRPATDIEMRISGKRDTLDWRANLTLATDLSNNASGISRLWARQKIQQLLDQQIMYADYERHKEAITTTALRHQLLSPYTSFVAVEERISRPETKPTTDKKIPNLAPDGSQAFNYPMTALNWQVQLLIGILLFVIGLWLNRGEDAYP